MTIEKLTIEDLAPYLFTNVNVLCNNETDRLTVVTLQYLAQNDSKLILRPLSDLAIEIEHGGQKFFPWDKLADKLLDEEPESFDNINYSKKWVETYFADKDILNIPYKLVSKLFEWHFDVFGLIEKGLAIDINILKP